MKKLILLLTVLLSFQAHASLNQEDVLKLMVGQWSVKIGGDEVKFVIRSSGDVMIVSNAHRDYVRAQLSFSYSTSSFGMDGLPVAHLILTEGSDEDVRDVHLLATGLQDGENSVRFKKLATFGTFNDGPNEYSDIENGSRFKRYNAETQSWYDLQ